MLSFIVTSYRRPDELMVCLQSLRNQRYPVLNEKFDDSLKRGGRLNTEIILCDNSGPYEEQDRIKSICDTYSAKYIATHPHMEPYAPSEIGASLATGEYLCFPSDDNWYAPEFAARLLLLNVDFAFCDMLYDPRYYGGWNGRYNVVSCEAKRCKIDKGGFIIRKKVFDEVGGFPGKPFPFKSEADGMLAELVVSRGYTVGHIPELMWFHG